MKQQIKQAFTLVELIVVITIIAILGTIAFISLQGYSSSARDSKRISDIQNIKKSLELFIVNTGKYPLPDNGETKSYSGDLLWIQGTVGDKVTSNLSKNLQKNPTDPLFETEYTYSVSNAQTEYELLAIYENDEYSNNILSSTYAASFTPKISGTFNQIFVKTPKYIVATPSIITSIAGNLDIKDNPDYIKSQVITRGKNIPNIGNGQVKTYTGGLTDFSLYATGIINSKSSDVEKISVINMLQTAYSGTTLATNQVISNILSKTSDSDKLELVKIIILNIGVVANNLGVNNTSSGANNNGPTYCVFGTGVFGTCIFQ